MAEPGRLSPLKQFRRIRSVDPQADLATFVDGLAALTPDQLLDLVEYDRNDRWDRGDRVTVDAIFRRFPTLENDKESAVALIYGEFHLRVALGEHPTADEYIDRYPRFARRLREQFQWHQAIDLEDIEGEGEDLMFGFPEIEGYRIEWQIGRGGMCTVYRGVRLSDNSAVAVKVLDSEHARSPDSAARFQREAEVGRRLDHPAILRVLETGVGEGIAFIVAELCSGGTLAERLQLSPLSVAVTIDLAKTIVGGLSYAHRHAVIHRDLKPSNILFRKAGSEPVIADFGLAKCLYGEPITGTEEVFGTPGYMAPEQTRNAKDADARTDVHAVGAILFECLTGRRPYDGRSAFQVLHAIQNGPVPSLADERLDIDPRVADIVTRCLQKAPESRFADADELLRRLESLDD